MIKRKFGDKRQNRKGNFPTPPLIGGYKTTIHGQEVFVKQYGNYFTDAPAKGANPKNTLLYQRVGEEETL